MNNERKLDLVYDLAKLLKRYGPETFECLARDLAKPQTAGQLALILSAAAKTARTQASDSIPIKPENYAQGIRASLEKLEELEPEKGAILKKLYEGFVAKTYLPTLREMQAFVSENDLPPLDATSRGKAIMPLMKILGSCPLEKVKTWFQEFQHTSYDNDRSLDAWSKVILARERR